MAHGDSLGPMGPNLISIEPVNDPAGGAVYSVEGHGFATGFKAEVTDGVGQSVASPTLSNISGTAFTLTLPFATPGPFTLVVVNPDGRSSSKSFDTPGTSDSNSRLRVNS